MFFLFGMRQKKLTYKVDLGGTRWGAEVNFFSFFMVWVYLQNESLVELIRDHEWGTFSPFLLSHSVKLICLFQLRRKRCVFTPLILVRFEFAIQYTSLES